LTIVPGAIVEDARIGKVTLHCDLAQDGRSSIYPSAQVRWGEPSSCTKQIEVETVDFGACLARYGVPYYLKSDIEGADLVCLRALAGFAARPCYVSIESSVSSLDAVAGEMDLLEGLGYHAFQAVQQQSTCHTRPPRPAREGRDVEHRFEFASSGLFGRELPERWVTRDRVLGQYRRIHRRYRVYQKVALWRRSRLLQRTVAVAGGAVHLVYAGWYDTHARHESVCSSRG
jgi:hypothetical protein